MPATSKRLNFFKGLFTSAEDWRKEQMYHIEKQRAHNAQLHVPGIVSGLDVKPSASGTAVQVSAGYAIDLAGRDLHLDRDVQMEIRFDQYKQPTTVFVVAQFMEKPSEPRQSVTNPEHSEHAFIEEEPDISILTEVPESALPLAQIKINPAEAKRIREASDGNAKDNEIDLHVRLRAGSIAAKTNLKDMAKVVAAGITNIAPHRDGGATEYEATATWRAEGPSHAFHLASAYPVDQDGEVSWRMGCLREGGELKYKLFIRNHGPHEMKVAYSVYRLA